MLLPYMHAVLCHTGQSEIHCLGVLFIAAIGSGRQWHDS